MQRDLADVRRAFEQWGEAHRRFVRAVQTARDAGATWRELGEAVGRSHEYMRSVTRHKLDR